MKLAVICLAVFCVYVNADTPHSKGPRCYDCNYAPSGYVLNKASGNNYLSRVGYQSCALRNDYDKKHVDKWGCKSGMCFIRKDYNGLVYRGCADKGNLPWGVDYSKNCQYQGPNKSLWFFCQGDLCNEGLLGESANLCGAPVNNQPIPQQQPQQPADNRKYGKRGATRDGYGIQDQRTSYGDKNDQGYGPVENQIEQKVNVYQPVSESVCNGDCYHNPSGLFPYAQDRHYFIQCDAGSYGNHPCTCCKPTVLPCPYDTEYNDELKVCTYANTKQYQHQNVYQAPYSEEGKNPDAGYSN